MTEQGTKVGPFVPSTRLRQAEAQGHRTRLGHTLTGYYVTTDTPGIVRLVRTCCGEDEGYNAP